MTEQVANPKESEDFWTGFRRDWKRVCHIECLRIQAPPGDPDVYLDRLAREGTLWDGFDPKEF